MSSPRELPPVEALRDWFTYDGVHLRWRQTAFNKTAQLGQVAGCVAPDGYRVVKLNGRCLKVHRIIWKMEYGTEPEEIDHDDRDRDNNRLLNLVESNSFHNKRNMSTTVSPDLPRGVHRHRRRFQAAIHVDGRFVRIGGYEDVVSASAAFERALLERDSGGPVTVYRQSGPVLVERRS